MARTLKATILMISEAPGEDGSPPIRRALAKYVLGDDQDAAAQLIRFCPRQTSPSPRARSTTTSSPPSGPRRACPDARR